MAVMTLTSENFSRVALQTSGPVLVEFWAPWCVYCRRLAPVLERVAEKLEGRVAVGQVNVDEEEELAERYGASTIPTLLLFKNGAHGEMLIAPPSQARLEDWLNAQLEG